ncbi:lipoyl(octanoyl) transferase LipB [Francisella frigiditurris]|uniref:Octanoyltransferase n=1 Tax=Francisella frigiditurris TaxID=1542390 RepID=A0A1J0KRA3_9GAMM|nr:lipoyl(octanoyl) transferase LipB [Francisella frigiditurris]APC96273.1 lipoyl(octanoyl) transferase [Francisella frigiditurris]
MNNIIKRNLGLKDYSLAFEQMVNFTTKRNSYTKDEIWLVEHPPVFTQGKHGKPEHLINAHNIPVIQTDRGGQITYHGPGQAVIYFLLDIKRLGLGAKKLVSLIEQACDNVLKKYNINTHLIDGAHGIYVKNKKIASLGLRVKQGKTYHGIAINIDMDLSPFSFINPCGYSGLEMCQMSDFEKNISMNKIQEEYSDEFLKLLESI